MAYRPDPEKLGMIKLAAAMGIPVKKIASLVGMAENTLRKYHCDILENAKTMRVIQVASKMYDLAMEGNVNACMFILKTQADQGAWSEKTQLITNEGEVINRVEVVIGKPKKAKEEHVVVPINKVENSDKTLQ